MRFRIVRGNTGYIAQQRCWAGWCSMFLGGFSDLPDQFTSVVEAEQAIRKWREEQIANPVSGTVMKEIEL